MELLAPHRVGFEGWTRKEVLVWCLVYLMGRRGIPALNWSRHGSTDTIRLERVRFASFVIELGASSSYVVPSATQIPG